jgi:hypothetical protein
MREHLRRVALPARRPPPPHPAGQRGATARDGGGRMTRTSCRAYGSNGKQSRCAAAARRRRRPAVIPRLLPAGRFHKSVQVIVPALPADRDEEGDAS